jgi:hypothetical protein
MRKGNKIFSEINIPEIFPEKVHCLFLIGEDT